MKTPNDLTQEQKELIGLHEVVEEGKEMFHSIPCDNLPLFVDAKIDTELHTYEIKFSFFI